MNTNYIIETKNLTKQYGSQKSVADLNIHVKRGRIYGLLGRNGAGKTTTMKMLLGLTNPTSGEVKIWGKPLQGNEKKLLPRIGSLIASPGFYPNLTGTENLRIFATLRGVPNNHAIVDCPILFLTAKTMENDITFGLGLGADDYLTKPFRIPELRARVNAHIRREQRERHSSLNFERIRIDLSAKTVQVDGEIISLTKSEYMICEFLARNKGQVFTREQIYEAVFSLDGESDNSTIATHIKNIRAKLNQYCIQPITTVWGIGYKWE